MIVRHVLGLERFHKTWIASQINKLETTLCKPHRNPYRQDVEGNADVRRYPHQDLWNGPLDLAWVMAVDDSMSLV